MAELIFKELVEGGWGAIVQLKKGEQVIEEKILSGRQRDTTNNRMELEAAIQGLAFAKNAKESIAPEARVTITTDSKYVQQGITSWIHDWKLKGWKTSGKKAVKNQEQWVQLDKLNTEVKVEWYWTKGHANNLLNERVDRIANAEAKQAQKEKIFDR